MQRRLPCENFLRVNLKEYLFVSITPSLNVYILDSVGHVTTVKYVHLVNPHDQQGLVVLVTFPKRKSHTALERVPIEVA